MACGIHAATQPPDEDEWPEDPNPPREMLLEPLPLTPMRVACAATGEPGSINNLAGASFTVAGNAQFSANFLAGKNPRK